MGRTGQSMRTMRRTGQNRRNSGFQGTGHQVMKGGHSRVRKSKRAESYNCLSYWLRRVFRHSQGCWNCRWSLPNSLKEKAGVDATEVRWPKATGQNSEKRGCLERIPKLCRAAQGATSRVLITEHMRG